MTAFTITQRPVRKHTEGVSYDRHCEAPGCPRSGRYTAQFLGAYDVRLCADCRTTWAKAWHDAKTNWKEQQDR